MEGLSHKQIKAKIDDLTSIRVHPIWYASGNDVSAHEQAKNELFAYVLETQLKKYTDVLENRIEKIKREIGVQERAHAKMKEEIEAQERAYEKMKEDFVDAAETIKTYCCQQKYYNSEVFYEFVLVRNKTSNNFFLSDRGKTFEMLRRN
jgi:hypothetical protein